MPSDHQAPQASTPITQPTGISHVRLTVSDIARSKAFYTHLLGAEPAVDFSDQVGEAGVLEDPKRMFGGCGYPLGQQLLGLRPAPGAGGSFDPTTVGLDHVSLQLASVDDLKAAQQRLADAGVEHGELTELPDLGLTIMSVQDPDSINLELAAPTDG